MMESLIAQVAFFLIANVGSSVLDWANLGSSVMLAYLFFHVLTVTIPAKDKAHQEQITQIHARHDAIVAHDRENYKEILEHITKEFVQELHSTRIDLKRWLKKYMDDDGSVGEETNG